MDKNIKILFGCGGLFGVCIGTTIGMVINEKLNQEFVVPNIKRYRDLAETFKSELEKSYKENEQLRNEILNKDRA